jgi:tetratricopeptide (TPR) repeat protein
MPERDLECIDDNAAGAFIEGRLPAAEGSALEQHLDQCASCRERVSVLAQLRSRSLVASSAGAEEAVAAPDGAFERYLIVGVLGAGAMGVVYAAYDPQLRRRVALKVLRPSATAAGAPDLLREARAMAMLQHPNVIAVHDVGDAGGRLFVAMELVDGMTLREWLARPRSPAEAIAALVQAGRGLVAAHAAGLVHRDFKPDNVLVGHDGRVRVTDFGLAWLGDDHDARRAGTPAYMAPEQFAGVVDARSDQFSFCVTLFEALYRRRPFASSRPADRDARPAEAAAGAEVQVAAGAEVRVAADPLAELRGQVLAGSAWPASPRLPRRVTAAIARGLEAEPERRFPTMAALLGALADERRRRPWLAITALAAAVTAAAALVGLGVERPAPVCQGAGDQIAAVWDAPRAAIVHARFAASRLPFAEAGFAALDDAMRRYTHRWAAMATESCRATRVRGEQTEELLALRAVCLDHRKKEVAALAGLFAQADAKLVERAAQAMERLSAIEDCADLQALTARRRASSPALRAQVDEVERALAGVRALADAGRFADVLTQAAALLARTRPLADHAALADVLFVLANDQARSGKDGDAANNAAEAALEAEAAGLDDIKARALLLWVRIVGATRFPEAHDALRRAAAAIERLGGDVRLKAALEMSEAQVLSAEGRHAEQLARMQEAVALDAQLPDADPLHRANLHGELAAALNDIGRHAEGLDEARAALAVQEQVLGPVHPTVALTVHDLAVALLEMGRPREALPQFQRALDIFAKTTPETLNVAHALDSTGNTLLALGRLDEAETFYRRALAMLDKLLGPGNWQSAFTLQNLAELRQRQGRLRDAAALVRQALGDMTRTLGADNADLAFPLVRLIDLTTLDHRFIEAQALGERALALAERNGPETSAVARVLRAIGELHLARGAAPEALAAFERSARIFAQRGDQPHELDLARFGIARALWITGRDRARALELARHALASLQAGQVADEAARIRSWLATVAPVR